MKWFLLLLLLLNGAVFYLGAYRAVPPELPGTASAVSSDNVARLVLLSELSDVEVALSGDCVVVGPVASFSEFNRFLAHLKELAVGHQHWAAEQSSAASNLRYWVQFEVSQRAVVGSRSWFNRFSQNPETEIAQKSCAAVASTGDLP